MVDRIPFQVLCTQCSNPFPPDFYNQRKMAPCPECGTESEVYVFPALVTGLPVGSAGAPILSAEEASCFYHPEKKAVVPCSHCGRFLCTLCDIELNNQHLCPTCITKGKKKGEYDFIENHRFLYDSFALKLALYPLLLFYITIITAPFVFFVVVRFWNKPNSIIPRTKIRMILALILAGLQITGWFILIIALIML